MIREARGEDFKGKTVAISGSGNVAQYAALKVIELGGTVVALSDSKGSLVSTHGKGFTPEIIGRIATLKLKGKYLPELGTIEGFKWVAGESLLSILSHLN